MQPHSNISISTITLQEASGGHSAAKKKKLPDDVVYTWGRGVSGVLGHGNNDDCLEPTPVANTDFGGGVLQISGGYMHLAILTLQGSIYTQGHPEDGRLGLGEEAYTSPCNVPQLVRGSRTKVSGLHAADLKASTGGKTDAKKGAVVAATGERLEGAHADEFSDNYSGDGDDGSDGKGKREGGGEKEHAVNLPLCRVVECGGAHSAMLDKDLNVWIWGSNRYGQLGLGTNLPDPCQLVPRPLLFFNGKGVCAVNLGFRHSCAVTLYGLLYVWGSHDCGQIGVKCNDYEPLPRVCDSLMHKPIVQVAACGSHTLAVSVFEHAQNAKFEEWKKSVLKQDEQRRKSCSAQFIDFLRGEAAQQARLRSNTWYEDAS